MAISALVTILPLNKSINGPCTCMDSTSLQHLDCFCNFMSRSAAWCKGRTGLHGKLPYIQTVTSFIQIIVCRTGLLGNNVFHWDATQHDLDLPSGLLSNVCKHSFQLSGWLQPVQSSTAHFTFMFFASLFAPRLQSSSIMSGDLLHAAICRAVHPCIKQSALSETRLSTLVLASVSQQDWYRHLQMAGQCNSLDC